MLATAFRLNGSYSAARLAGAGGTGPQPASSQLADAYEEFFGFASLEVQSVGFAEGPEEDAVYVYVTRGTKKDLSLVPTEFNDVPVHVENVGRIAVRLESASARTTNRPNVFTRNDRIACGSSCAPSGETYAGTFGALVRRTDDAALYMLSNNHVLAACNHVPKGQPIMAPASIDAAPTIRAPLSVATHHDIVELRSGDAAFVEAVREDVAIARIVDPATVTSWQGDGVAGYDTPRAVIAPAAQMRVKKVGRTTALTSGTVQSFDVNPQPIPYKSRFFQATVWVKEVWVVRADPSGPFALGGDSGSLIVTEDGRSAVGLLFAQSNNGQYGFMVPFTHVATLCGGLSLVTAHGI